MQRVAFVQVRMGDPAAALANLDELGSEPAQLSVNGREAYSAALAALDRKEEAEALAAGIDWNQFAEVEAKILRSHCIG